MTQRRFLCLLLACTSLSVTACTGASEPVGINEQAKSLTEDLRMMFADQDAITQPLSMYDAMARAVAYNLDARVATQSAIVEDGKINQEKLGLLPSMNASGSYAGRSDKEIISGRDAATGAQSLVPTQFEDSHGRNASLDISWNILDAGLSYARSQSATDQQRIASEQKRKAIHSIMQDVRDAYWRAAAAQSLDAHVAGLNKKAMKITRDLQEAENSKSTVNTGELLTLQKNILDTLDDLMAERKALSTAKDELASLMGLPPESNFTLSAKETDILSPLPNIKTPKDDLYAVALLVRPELREGILQSRISARESDMQVLRTLPVVGGTVGYYYDSNSFLSNQNWTGASLSLTQNLMSIFTLPTRLDSAQNNHDLSLRKRQAVTGAVLTQVNIARTQYQLAREHASLARERYGVSARTTTLLKDEAKQAQTTDSQLNLVDSAHLTIAELDQLLSRTRLMMAYASAQNGYGRMMQSLGLDPLPATLDEHDVASMAKVIEQRDRNLDDSVLAGLVESIRARTELLDPNSGIMANMKPKPIQLADQKI